MARIIIMITSQLHKTCELRLQIFICHDVIWIVLELSFMLLYSLVPGCEIGTLSFYKAQTNIQ